MGKVKLSEVEVKFTEDDVELYDYVVDGILDDINKIRDLLSAKETVSDYDIERYLDKICEIIIQLSDDHKLYVIFANQTMSVVKQLAKIILGGKSNKEVTQEDKDKIAGMFL